jgi:stringent starvation protein A
VLTLYNAERCPYVGRVRIVLAEKQIPYESHWIDLGDKPALLYEKNPAGRVPVIEEGAFVLAESTCIMDYLDERFPEPALLPADPAERALARLLIWRHDDFSSPYYAVRRGDEGAQGRFDAALRGLDALLEAQPYLTGREFGLADIAYVPWIFRAQQSFGLDVQPYPALAEWVERLLERPSVAAESAVVAAL